MKLRKNNQHNLRVMAGAPIEFHALGPVNYQATGLLTYAVNEEFARKALNNPDITALITTAAIYERIGMQYMFDGWLISDDPAADFFRFHNWLTCNTQFYQFNQSSVDGVKIGTAGRLGVSIIASHNVEIARNTIIEPGAIIGYPGARFVYAKDGVRIDVAHVGGVHICEGATIGANAVIVQSVWPRPTLIGKNAFIGNLVNVGHNAQVEDNAVVLSGAILGGSCVIGEGATVDIGAVIRPHVTVGPGAYVSMDSVVTRDVPAGQRVTGNWAVEHSRFVRRVKRWGDS